MILLSTIINQFKDGFLARYQNFVLPGHKKALWAMARCRQQTYIPHSCGHRSCPHCQNHESGRWIEKELNKRLAAPYFLLTFTLPKELRNLAWRNQQAVYSLLFSCVQATPEDLCQKRQKIRW